MTEPLPIALIEMLTTVAETRSFTQSAQRLGVTKATISRGIARLEELLGEPLVLRNSHRVDLTALGQAMFERASTSIGALRSLRDSLPRQKEVRVAGTVRVLAPVDVALAILPPVLDRFTRTFPEANVDLIAGERSLGPIGDGADVCMRTTWSHELPANATIILRGELCAYAKQGYELSSGRPNGVYDKRHRWVVNHVPRMRLPSVTVAVSDFATALSVIEQGGAIGMLPSYLGDRAVARGLLSRIAIPGYAPPSGSLYVFAVSERTVPPRVSKFIEVLIEATR